MPPPCDAKLKVLLILADCSCILGGWRQDKKKRLIIQEKEQRELGLFSFWIFELEEQLVLLDRYSPSQPLGLVQVSFYGYLIVPKLLNCCFSQIRGTILSFFLTNCQPKFLLSWFFQWLAWEPEYNEGPFTNFTGIKVLHFDRNHDHLFGSQVSKNPVAHYFIIFIFWS